MPFGYAERFMSRLGYSATLYTRSTSAVDATWGTLTNTSLSLNAGVPFDYTPVVVNSKVRSMMGGWVDDMDRVIQVVDDLNISTRNKYDTDIVDIDSKRYLVGHVTTNSLIRHGYKMVGLKSQAQGTATA